MSTPSKPHKLTKAERKAAAALRRPNPALPPHDHRGVKFSTAEDNVRRVTNRYARLKFQGKGEEVELMRQGDEIVLRLREMEKNMIENGRMRKEIKVMAVEAWKGWLDGLDEEDRRKGIVPPAEEEREKDSFRLQQTSFAIQSQPQGVNSPSSVFNVSITEYVRQRDASKAALDSYLQQLQARMFAEGRPRSAIQDAVAGAQTKWHVEWPYVPPDANTETAKKWLDDYKAGVERKKVEAKIKLRKEVMIRIGKPEEEIRDMEEKAWMKWREEFPEDAYLVDQEIGIKPMATTGLGEAGAVSPGFATWEKICWIYNKRRDVSKQVFERSLAVKIQGMRCAKWSEFEISKALEPDWKMWRGQWPEVDAGDEERGRRVWETYRGKQRMVMEKQVEVKRKVMAAAGKSEAEIEEILNKGWGKWRNEFPEIWSANDGDNEDEFETERLANKIGEIEVTEREVGDEKEDGENEKGENEVDESVYDTDTEGGVDLRYSESVYDTDTDTEGGVDLGAWDGYDD